MMWRAVNTDAPDVARHPRLASNIMTSTCRSHCLHGDVFLPRCAISANLSSRDSHHALPYRIAGIAVSPCGGRRGLSGIVGKRTGTLAQMPHWDFAFECAQALLDGHTSASPSSTDNSIEYGSSGTRRRANRGSTRLP